MRNCTRCGKELTDAASMEVGIGPICRNLDNAVLATYIPADLDLAQELASGLDERAFPEVCHETFAKVLDAIANPHGHDWRVPVKRIEWMLSFIGFGRERTTCTSIVRALGYLALAALWSGNAATGKCLVFAKDGKLFYVGPRNKAARETTKAIRGRRFHPAGEAHEKPAWSVPGNEGAAFKRLIITHYPNFEVQGAADLDALVAQAATVCTDDAKVEPEVKIVDAGDWLIVKSPYHPGFVSEVKSLPWADRKWNGPLKAWNVHKRHEMFVRALIKRAYGVACMEVAA